jgi:hypothetical protein
VSGFRLSNDVYSPDHIGIVLWELERLIGWLRDVSVRTSVAGQDSTEKEVHLSTFLLGVLKEADVSSDDLPALEQLQTTLQAVRDQAPVAHMVLTALPNRSLKRQLVEWFRKEVHQQCLVTFAVRSDLGGGFLLRIGSKQYDFTFRGRLLENKHRIAEIFDGVR